MLSSHYQMHIATLLDSTEPSVATESSVEQRCLAVYVPMTCSFQILHSSLLEGQPNHHKLHLIPLCLELRVEGNFVLKKLIVLEK